MFDILHWLVQLYIYAKTIRILFHGMHLYSNVIPRPVSKRNLYQIAKWFFKQYTQWNHDSKLITVILVNKKYIFVWIRWSSDEWWLKKAWVDILSFINTVYIWGPWKVSCVSSLSEVVRCPMLPKRKQFLQYITHFHTLCLKLFRI